MLFGAVVREAADGDKGSVAGHRTTVVIPALHFVERVALIPIVALIEGLHHSHALLDHPFGDHVGGHLGFKAVHRLVQVAGKA